jgi:NodT family efflux transporter outer membrane factor (OMF) lipoprotein
MRRGTLKGFSAIPPNAPWQAARRVRRVRGRIALAAMGVLVCGCEVGPDYEPVPVPISAQFKELEGWKIATPADGVERGDWWSIYGDETLDGLLREVDVNNQNVAAAEAAFHSSAAIVQQARSALFPALGVSYIPTRWHQGAGAAAAYGSPSASTITQTTVTLAPEVAWTLDIWGETRRQVESDIAAAQGSAADLANASLLARTQLAQAYFNLRAADSLQRLLDDTVAAYRKTYEIADARYKRGTVSIYDVITAKTQVQTTLSQAIGVGIQRAQFEHAIAVLIGRPPADVSIPQAPLGRRIPVIPPSVPSALLERRPDIAHAERGIASKNALIGVAVAAYFPNVSLAGFGDSILSYASYGWVGSKAFPIAVANEVWSVGANVAEVIFEGGLRSGQVAAALANYYQSVASYRQTVLTALQQVEDQLSNLRILADQARALAKAVNLARDALHITIDEYKQGTVDFTAVVQAQEVLLTNEINALTVRQNRFLASVTLIQALGGGWDTSWLPAYEQLRHWRTCVTVRDVFRGPLDPEMPPCL